MKSKPHDDNGTTVIDLASLDAKEVEQYRRFVSWRQDHLLSTQPKSALLLGLQHHQEPAGLAIIAINRLNGFGDILSIEVVPQLKTVDTYVWILNAIKERCIKKGLRILTMFYTPPSPPLDEAMTQSNWEAPHPWSLKIEFDSNAFNPPWFARNHPLPKGFTTFPLLDISPEQERQITHHLEQSDVNPFLSPFNHREYLQPINSLGLCRGDEVVGWIATHTFPDREEYVHYSALYIKPEYHSLGYAIALLTQSIRLQQTSPIRWSSMEVNIHESRRGWMKFIEKRLLPFSIKSVESVRREYFI